MIRMVRLCRAMKRRASGFSVTIMAKKLHLQDIFEGNRLQKIVLVVSVLLFLLLELLIYMASASHAGHKSHIIISDMQGNSVYQTTGNTLTSYEKLIFEKNFGPLTDYQLEIVTETRPFPFRAWFTAAVGIPVGLILLVSFLVKVYLTLLYNEEEQNKQGLGDTASGLKEGKFASLFQAFGQISIFHIGFGVLASVLLLWMVPNLVEDIFTISTETIRDYKWFFVGVALFLAFIITWVIYLRYRLSKQMLDNQFNIEKYRLEQQLLTSREQAPTLLPKPDDSLKTMHDG